MHWRLWEAVNLKVSNILGSGIWCPKDLIQTYSICNEIQQIQTCYDDEDYWFWKNESERKFFIQIYSKDDQTTCCKCQLEKFPMGLNP